MTGDCKHIRERLLGYPPSGACDVCCPWMFPTRAQLRASDRWFRDWRASKGIERAVDHVEEISPREWELIREHLQVSA